MSNKFSFLLTIEKDGTPSAKIYKKEDAQRGVDDFMKTRAQGGEAYWFQSPRPDKRCKSEASREELKNSIHGVVSEGVAQEVEFKSVKTSKKQSKISEGISDLD